MDNLHQVLHIKALAVYFEGLLRDDPHGRLYLLYFFVG